MCGQPLHLRAARVVQRPPKAVNRYRWKAYLLLRIVCAPETRDCHMRATEIRGSPAKACRHTCIAHNMHQTDLHLLGTAPPMPPPPLLQSLPEPPLITVCGRRAYVAGGEGLHAPLEQHGNVQPRQRGQRKSSPASKHQQNTARQHACMRAMHT